MAGHDSDHMGSKRINVSGEFGCEGGRGKSTDGGFSSGDELIFHVRDGENLLLLGVFRHICPLTSSHQPRPLWSGRGLW